jgi:hypothetical protein
MTEIKRTGPVVEVETSRSINFLPTQPRANKRKNSNFVVNFNTNYRPLNRDAVMDMTPAYMDILDDLMKDDEFLIGATQILDANNVPRPITESEWEEHIFRVKVSSQPEVGSDVKRGARFHIHSSIYFLHDVKLRLDGRYMKEEFNKRLSAAGLREIQYVHIEATKVPGEYYAEKDKY